MHEQNKLIHVISWAAVSVHSRAVAKPGLLLAQARSRAPGRCDSPPETGIAADKLGAKLLQSRTFDVKVPGKSFTRPIFDIIDGGRVGCLLLQLLPQLEESVRLAAVWSCTVLCTDNQACLNFQGRNITRG